MGDRSSIARRGALPKQQPQEQLFDTHPDSVMAQLARRDRDSQSDFFAVYFDPYRDGRTGYEFLVSAAGVQSDGTLHNDETSTHRPFGEGQLDFDAIMPVLNQSGCNSPWWAVDLCFWPGSWEATPGCKQFMDHLNEKYGTTAQGQAH